MCDKKTRVFVVTGANRGIGFAIVRGIAKSVDGVVYLTARNPEFGRQAVDQIKLDLGAHLKADVRPATLDITDQGSVNDLRTLLEHDGVDVLINNAGIAFNDDVDTTEESEHTSARRRVEQVESVIDVNYYGTKRVCEALIPIIRPGGRQVSEHIRKYKSELTADLLSPHVSVETIDQFVEDYKKLVREEQCEEGFTLTAYKISKATELAFSKVLARDLRSLQIKVNACCPGFCATRLSDWTGPLDAMEGADTPVYLAVDPSAPAGVFIFERKVIAW
ncbi:hypothetical protein QR680_012874 [Steinernema hermaphroditum]|uniref:Carbonyl reductase [NADPH] 1 n=1 Tax=Steinernema hermaphroditum TaxID=289476 RepID=A0AA39M0M3_9BILA|nr:hypothetical protein QR680_012874 [Steinernema hermaphroditum]